MGKRIISLVLGFFMLIPLAAFAQTSSAGQTVQEQTAALLRQIAVLQAQIIVLQNSNITPTQQQLACSQEAKLCPDGTYVGRTGPACEFVCHQYREPHQ